MAYKIDSKNRRIVIFLLRTHPLVEAIDVCAARESKTAPRFICESLAAGVCAEELARIEARTRQATKKAAA